MIKRHCLKVLKNAWIILNRFKMYKPGTAGLLIFIAAIFMAIFAPFISPYSPSEFSDLLFSPPSFQHLMGTDQFGRDILSRVLWGARVPIMVALVSSGISAGIGAFLGAISGYKGGVVDDILTRIFDLFYMIPPFFLTLIIAAIYGTSIYLVMIVIGLTTWPSNARIMRAQVLSLKSSTFVESVIIAGGSWFRVLFMHIIPNGIYPIITNSTLEMGSAILIEAGLSFLGLSDINVISWGPMVRIGVLYLGFAWWASFFPGFMILILVIGLNLLGDGINYVLNPRIHEMY